MIDLIQSFTFDYAMFITLNLVLSTIVILLERKNSTAALAWLFFLNLFPGFGFFFYIILSQNISKRKIFAYSKEEERLFNKALNHQKHAIRENQFDYGNTETIEHKDLILFHNRMSNALLSTNDHVDIFNNGPDLFRRLFEDISKAQEHIHLLYFIIKNDEIGNKLINQLIKKAAEGVEVRLLVDHVGGRTLSPKLIRKIKSSKIQLAFFFPSKFKYFNLKGNYRNHRKIVVIDGTVGYIGGLNVGNEYVGKSKRFGYWRDTHLRLYGDSVMSLQLRFILDWRNASMEKLATTAKYLRHVVSDSKTAIQIVCSGPDNINQQIKQGYLQIIHKAKKYIYIQTPYFIPDDSILEGLKIAAASGVDVRIMIPQMPDHLFVYWATYSYCGDLIPYGVKIFIYERGFLHSKMIVSDNTIASVGSCNFDIRSFKLNFEANAFIYERRTSIGLRKEFDEDLRYCRQLTQTIYDKRSFWIKFKESISRLFSPVL